jgi:hypothetical protein
MKILIIAKLRGTKNQKPLQKGDITTPLKMKNLIRRLFRSLKIGKGIKLHLTKRRKPHTKI